jgi:hypothetical protein
MMVQRRIYAYMQSTTYFGVLGDGFRLDGVSITDPLDKLQAGWWHPGK